MRDDLDDKILDEDAEVCGEVIDCGDIHCDDCDV